MKAIRLRVVIEGGVDSILLWFELVDLLNVNCKTASCVKTTRTHATFEVLGLLVLHQN
jgi:hypothetical protein